MVSAAPVPSAALRVRLAVTETVDTLAGSAPSSVPIPAGRGSVELELRTADDGRDEGDSVVTAAVLPDPAYKGAGTASYMVLDNDADTARGKPRNLRFARIEKPGFPQDMVAEPLMVLRFAWDPPADVPLGRRHQHDLLGLLRRRGGHDVELPGAL